MDKITKEGLTAILDSIAALMEEQKQFLVELDGSMGDGDLGLTMCNGFNAVKEEIRTQAETDMGKLLMKLGMKMNSTVPSTMGTLISTCFLKAATKAKGKTELTLADQVAMGEGAVSGVMERGKTKRGEKTMLDVLAPAIDALKEASAQGKNLSEAWLNALAAAEKGLEETKKMEAVHGRAAYYREKSIGRPDPGAAAMMYVIKGIALAVK